MSAELFSLKGKVVLITGATNGIGQYMAVGLYEAGAEVILTHRDTTDPQPTIDLIKASNPESEAKISVIKADFEKTALDKVFETIVEPAYKLSSSGKIDILINNAGTASRANLEDFEQSEFDRQLHVNLNIPIRLTQEIGRDMIKQGTHGKIIFTASLLSFQGGVRVAPYTTSKGGILQFSKAAANEWAPKNIQVNSIAPGWISSNMTNDLETDPKANADIVNRIPAGRWGKPEDLKGATVFLASRASDYITGECIVVDGGWMAR
ncbi:unnamed protein product [Kuraishia capsulata CBS 1993]|uniref:2-deoxy-D-gluconate 3-dehydrogenase n=1 Tax=Kuraishia capsulata CBS 1993 TaxID=1382522 RepID=W6MN02_9ASCO|nr:uncharacterized protein KUCA_T00003582001 [Kuraishia capsulata CBS 1993]CDK27603.1 unnamed protein product [Kuraishia capsulata CBS 1993]